MRQLERERLVTVEPIPDAFQIYFENARLDAIAGTFDRDFPGRHEVGRPTRNALSVIVFKSFPQRKWLDQLAEMGIIALEPIRTMGYIAYGPRGVIDDLPGRLPCILAAFEMPAGLKRFSIDDRDEGDDDGPAPTTVTVVSGAREDIIDLLRSATGKEPTFEFETGTTEAWTVDLAREEAMTLSLLPEVVTIARKAQPVTPSDERSNRIIGGTWQPRGDAWPSSLGSNSTNPKFWDGFLSGLEGLGLDMKHQVIGIVDTGIDSGLMKAGQGYCPPFLIDPTDPNDSCRLVFVTDETEGFGQPETRGDDKKFHGTFVAALAAGFTGAGADRRDGENWSFTQGVAQGARVASCTFHDKPGTNCNISFRAVGEAQPFTTAEQRLRYALVELGTVAELPDLGQPGPGAGVFNHSWNLEGVRRYDELAYLLDQASRKLSTACFNFREAAYPNRTRICGPATSSLHVVSAGNWAGGNRLVTSPGAAKNVITVGSTETYNQMGYASGCQDNNSENADDPHQISNFSRFGFPNLRLKPDLVAPGTRAYGPRSTEYDPGCEGTDCNLNLVADGQAGWSYGTSFSAPVVTGAAALVREWLRAGEYVLGDPSPALVKATLVATARTLTRLPVCGVGCGTCCASCGDMRPAPDKYQGWGGVSLDRLFRSSSNYHFVDQPVKLTPESLPFTLSLSLTDTSADVNVALVWTDRAGPTAAEGLNNLVNDLDLVVTATGGGQTASWYGNNFCTAIDSCARDGYSLKNPTTVIPDRKNNVEKISSKAADIPQGATTITVQMTVFSLTGDGTNPSGNSAFRQDFALAVENAHE